MGLDAAWAPHGLVPLSVLCSLHRGGAALSRATPPVTTPRPLADSEKLPVQKHRDTETSKSPERQDVTVVEKKSKKPKRKEKKQKEKEREKKKKKEAEKVRGQAACHIGRGGPGLPAVPLPLRVCHTCGGGLLHNRHARLVGLAAEQRDSTWPRGPGGRSFLWW